MPKYASWIYAIERIEDKLDQLAAHFNIEFEPIEFEDDELDEVDTEAETETTAALDRLNTLTREMRRRLDEHRQHAVVELCIRDLKDQALEHFPSGQFNANAAWTVIACLAHNLLRWTGLLGLPDSTIRAARTIRRRLLALPGRLTSHAGHWTLHLPARWPWQEDFGEALTRIRALPAAA